MIEVGDKISVVLHWQANARSIHRAHVDKLDAAGVIYYVLHLPHLAPSPRLAGAAGVCNEGIAWCPGWEGEHLDALRAANAIE